MNLCFTTKAPRKHLNFKLLAFAFLGALGALVVKEAFKWPLDS
jgi:hypothetical protein